MTENLPPEVRRTLNAVPCAAAVLGDGETIYRNKLCGTEFDAAIDIASGLRAEGVNFTGEGRAVSAGTEPYIMTASEEKWGTMLYFTPDMKNQKRQYVTRGFRDDLTKAFIAYGMIEDKNSISAAGTMLARRLCSLFMRVEQMDITQKKPSFTETDAAMYFRALAEAAEEALAGLGVELRFEGPEHAGACIDQEMMSAAFYAVLASLIANGSVGNSIRITMKAGRMFYLTIASSRKRTEMSAFDSQELGLYTACAAVAAHGGSFIETDTPEGGTAVTISFCKNTGKIAGAPMQLRSPSKPFRTPRGAVIGLCEVMTAEDFRKSFKHRA